MRWRWRGRKSGGNNTSVVFTWIERDEIRAAEEVFTRCFGEKARPAFKEMLERGVGGDQEKSRFLAARIDAAIVGIGFYQSNVDDWNSLPAAPPHFRIGGLCVLPERRRDGIGEKLMNGLIRDIQDTVGPGQNGFIDLVRIGASETYYEKFGFRTVYAPFHGRPATMARQIFERQFSP